MTRSEEIAAQLRASTSSFTCAAAAEHIEAQSKQIEVMQAAYEGTRAALRQLRDAFLVHNVEAQAEAMRNARSVLGEPT